MKKVLITTTTPYMIRQFLLNDISLLIKLGYKVEVGTNFKKFGIMSDEALSSLFNQLKMMNVKINQISFTNKIYDFKQLMKSYNEMKALLNYEHYDIVHTHTPIAGFITRIAYKNSSLFPKCKMIYTAHGFHFFEGNKRSANFVFKVMEQYAARYTDSIITINNEDYLAASHFRLKDNGTVYKIPGVGIDVDKIKKITGNKEKLCDDECIDLNSFLLISVGELRKRKNHEMIIRIIPNLPQNVHYVICGTGKFRNELESLADKLHIKDRVHFLGFRTDVIEIIKSCDLFVFPSYQEGLPVSLLEALAAGIPCFASNIRGNADLLENNIDCLFEVDNDLELTNKIRSFLNNPFKMNTDDIMEYDIKNVSKLMENIYLSNMKM